MRSDIIFYLYLLIVSVPECFGKHSNSSDEAVQSVDQDFSPPAYDEPQSSSPWISEIFAKAEKSFTISQEASAQCKHDFHKYKLHLRNNSLWAVRMSESSHWPKLGLFMGTSPSMGHFDECTAINAYGIKGQQCVIESVYHIDEKFSIKPVYPLDPPNEENSAWFALEMFKNDIHRDERNKLIWTMCTPSSCSSSDLIESLERTLNHTFGKYSINITTRIEKNWCHSNEIVRSEYYYHVKYFIGLLIVTVILSSVNHSWRTKVADNGIFSSVLDCFSIQKNYRNLVEFDRDREYMLIHLQKVIFCVLSTGIHIWAFELQFQRYNAEVSEQFVTFLNQESIFWGGPETVDRMFAFSGIFMYQSFIQTNSENDNIIKMVMRMAKRWLRLFSTYLVIRLFYGHMFPVMNNGVLWHKVEEESMYCRTNLVPALLTLPSARTNTMCIVTSWQIAIDFQLFCITYLYLCLCRRYKINAIKAILSFMAVSSMLALGMNFYKQYGTVIFFYIRELPMDRVNPDHLLFRGTYLSTIPRMIPYLTGCLIAATAHEMKLLRRVPSKALEFCGLFFTIFAKFWSGTYAYRLHLQPNADHGRTRDAILTTFYYAARNVQDYFLIFLYLVHGIQFLEKRIPRIIVALSRLTYSYVLTHFIIFLARMFSQRTLPALTMLSSVHSLVADVFLTYLLSFFVYLVVEGPVQNLTSRFLSDARKVKTEQPKKLKKEN